MPINTKPKISIAPITYSLPSLVHPTTWEMDSLPFSPLSPSTFPSKPPLFQKLREKFTATTLLATRRNASSSSSISSFESSSNYGHPLVDDIMIVPRKRIHDEMIMVERNYEPPSHWMEWEKQYYTCYDEFICQFVGFLQTQLMNSRPPSALGMLFSLILSVPISTMVVGSRLVEMANGAFSAICG